MKTARLTPGIAFSIVLLSTVAPALAGIVRWTSNGPIVPTAPTAFARDPSTSGTIYVGTQGDGGGFQLLKSTNGGVSFSTLNWNAVRSIGEIVASSDPAVLYALGDGNIQKSTDGGQSWSPVSRPPGNSNTQEILVDPSNPGTLYALTGSSGGAFKSTDDGATWLGRPE